MNPTRSRCWAIRPTAPASCWPRPPRPAVDGGFTLDDFTVDEAAATMTCPNGLTARITRTRKVIFGARCHGCPLRARCTSSTRGRKLALHPHDALHRAHRGPRPGSRVPGRLPPAPAHGRTVDLLAGRRPQPAAAVRRDTAQ